MGKKLGKMSPTKTTSVTPTTGSSSTVVTSPSKDNVSPGGGPKDNVNVPGPSTSSSSSSVTSPTPSSFQPSTVLGSLSNKSTNNDVVPSTSVSATPTSTSAISNNTPNSLPHSIPTSSLTNVTAHSSTSNVTTSVTSSSSNSVNPPSVPPKPVASVSPTPIKAPKSPPPPPPVSKSDEKIQTISSLPIAAGSQTFTAVSSNNNSNTSSSSTSTSISSPCQRQGAPATTGPSSSGAVSSTPSIQVVSPTPNTTTSDQNPPDPTSAAPVTSTESKPTPEVPSAVPSSVPATPTPSGPQGVAATATQPRTGTKRRDNQAGFEEGKWYKIRNVADNSVVHLDEGNKLVCRVESDECHEQQLFRATRQPNGAYRIAAKIQKSSGNIQVWDYLPHRALLLQRKESQVSKAQQNWKSQAVPGFNSLYLIVSSSSGSDTFEDAELLCIKNMGVGQQIKIVAKDEKSMADDTTHWYIEELVDDTDAN